MKTYTTNQLIEATSPQYLSDEKLLQSLLLDRLENPGPCNPWLINRMANIRVKLNDHKIIKAIHQS